MASTKASRLILSQLPRNYQSWECLSLSLCCVHVCTVTCPCTCGDRGWGGCFCVPRNFIHPFTRRCSLAEPEICSFQVHKVASISLLPTLGMQVSVATLDLLTWTPGSVESTLSIEPTSQPLVKPFLQDWTAHVKLYMSKSCKTIHEQKLNWEETYWRLKVSFLPFSFLLFYVCGVLVWRHGLCTDSVSMSHYHLCMYLCTHRHRYTFRKLSLLLLWTSEWIPYNDLDPSRAPVIQILGNRQAWGVYGYERDSLSGKQNTHKAEYSVAFKLPQESRS